MLKLQDSARSLTTKVLDLFVERLREYVVYRLKSSIHMCYSLYLEYADEFVKAAQGRGPPDAMKDDKVRPVKITDHFEGWDLFALISIFHDHFDTLFSNDFNQSAKPKTILLQIRDIRNKRAHDNPINARETYRLADLAQLFFDSTSFTEVIGGFEQVRMEALELLICEEKEKHMNSLAQQQQQQFSQQQNIAQMSYHQESNHFQVEQQQQYFNLGNSSTDGTAHWNHQADWQQQTQASVVENQVPQQIIMETAQTYYPQQQQQTQITAPLITPQFQGTLKSSSSFGAERVRYNDQAPQQIGTNEQAVMGDGGSDQVMWQTRVHSYDDYEIVTRHR